jgi:hypothetical protein
MEDVKVNIDMIWYDMNLEMEAQSRFKMSCDFEKR